MVIKSFNQLIERVKGQPVRKIMAVAAAGDAHTLQAVIRAQKEGLAEPLLVGDKAVIRNLLNELGAAVKEEQIYDCPDMKAAAEFAVKLVKEGRADFLMKGRLDTSVLLKAVVDKEKGLGLGRTMSHFTIFEIPPYHKLLAIVDGGMVTYPTLDQKKDIILNTVDVFRALGCQCPKVGILACVEKVNNKMPETVEAAALKEMNRRGKINNCIVEGPISYDCAVNSEIAKFKGVDSPVAGDADILVVPNIHTGNIAGKALTCSAGAKMAGFVVGAACPVVLTSRASSAEEKYLSIVVSAAVRRAKV